MSTPSQSHQMNDNKFFCARFIGTSRNNGACFGTLSSESSTLNTTTEISNHSSSAVNQATQMPVPVANLPTVEVAVNVKINVKSETASRKRASPDNESCSTEYTIPCKAIRLSDHNHKHQIKCDIVIDDTQKHTGNCRQCWGCSSVVKNNAVVSKHDSQKMFCLPCFGALPMNSQERENKFRGLEHATCGSEQSKSESKSKGVAVAVTISAPNHTDSVTRNIQLVQAGTRSENPDTNATTVAMPAQTETSHDEPDVCLPLPAIFRRDAAKLALLGLESDDHPFVLHRETTKVRVHRGRYCAGRYCRAQARTTNSSSKPLCNLGPIVGRFCFTKFPNPIDDSLLHYCEHCFTTEIPPLARKHFFVYGRDDATEIKSNYEVFCPTCGPAACSTVTVTGPGINSTTATGVTNTVADTISPSLIKPIYGNPSIRIPKHVYQQNRAMSEGLVIPATCVKCANDAKLIKAVRSSFEKKYDSTVTRIIFDKIWVGPIFWIPTNRIASCVPIELLPICEQNAIKKSAMAWLSSVSANAPDGFSTMMSQKNDVQMSVSPLGSDPLGL